MLTSFGRSWRFINIQTSRSLPTSRRLKLSEKLTDKTILDLQAQGAQPKTVAALQELRDEAAALKPPSHDATYSPATVPDNTGTGGEATIRLNSRAAPIPPPDSVRQQQILSQIKEYALNYTKNLPNFICVEVIRRYVDPMSADHFQSIGNVLARVSYNQGQESYKVYSVNGRMEDTTIDRAAAGGGAISQGEFGSMMREIFEERSGATFNWDHWATLRGRRMAVFSYAIGSGRSGYSIDYSSGPGDDQRIYTAYRGLSTRIRTRARSPALRLKRSISLMLSGETSYRDSRLRLSRYQWATVCDAQVARFS